ncbi:MAG: ACT domain-containing protein, partial [Nitrososphaeraceae archaeon]
MHVNHTIDSQNIVIEVTVVGKDHKGIVADITNFIFKNRGNIEQINQNVVHGFFGMHLQASFQKKINRNELDDGMRSLSKKLQMEIKVHYQEADRVKNVAILVSKEDHCLLTILASKKMKEIRANIEVIIGSTDILKPIAEGAGIPFYVVNNIDQSEAENHILQLIEQYNIDLIVLAKYMR